MALLALLASAACLATPVQGNKVKAGPFTGVVMPQYDVVQGRFRLHVGPYRDRVTGLSQKIGWVVPVRYRVGGWLTVTGRRLNPSRQTFWQKFEEAYSPDFHDGWVFPSDITPPSAGCWRLTLSSGNATGTLTVLVRG